MIRIIRPRLGLLTIGMVALVLSMLIFIVNPVSGGSILHSKTYEISVRIEGTATSGKISAILLEPTTFWIIPSSNYTEPKNISYLEPMLIGYDGGSITVSLNCNGYNIRQDKLVDSIWSWGSRTLRFKFRIDKNYLPCDANVSTKLYEGGDLVDTMEKGFKLQ